MVKQFALLSRATRNEAAADTAAPALTMHDRIIAGLAPPPWLRNDSLQDHQWIIETDDGSARRGTLKTIKFDVPIAPGLLLTDEDSEHDLVTAKMLVYYSLTASEGIYKTASSVVLFARNYVQFVRWRRHCGLRRNADLTEAWLSTLADTIHAVGITDLLPHGARASALVAQFRAGEVEVPIYSKGNRRFLSTDPVAKLLGFENWKQVGADANPVLDEFIAEQGLMPRSYKGKPLTDLFGEEPTPFEVEEGNTGGRADEPAMSYNRVSAFLQPIALLYKYKRRLAHDPIGFDPYPPARNVNAVATAIARPLSRRTFTVPAAQACHLIDAALRFLLDYAPDIMRFVECVNSAQAKLPADHWRPHETALKEVSATFVPSDGTDWPHSPFPIYPAYWQYSGWRSASAEARPPLRVVLFEYLAVAAMIVIAAFSARRKEEIESLKAGCIKYKDGEAWLETWIEKTMRDLDRIPIPESVAKAVEVLEWLSLRRREVSGAPWLFEFKDMVSCDANRAVDAPEQRSAGFDVYRALESFARFVKVPPLVEGLPWAPKPHEFRRFFGIAYYHHYRFASLTALSNFYRHYDPDMTRRYITESSKGGFLKHAEEQRIRATKEQRYKEKFDQQRLEDFRSEGLNFRVERYGNVAVGTERVSGWGGEQLARELAALVADLRTRLQIGPEDDLAGPSLTKAMQEFAEDRRLEPNSLGHSYCKCTTKAQDLAAANCLQRRDTDVKSIVQRSAPDPAYAADLVCSACPHNVQFAENESYWKAMAEREGRAASCAVGTIRAATAAKRRDGALDHLLRCFKNSGHRNGV